MIGHFLLALTAEQADRVLTKYMQPGSYWTETCGACLVGTVHGSTAEGFASVQRTDFVEYKRGRRVAYLVYEDLCTRFGAPRINVAIRSRVLANQARRVLSSGRVVRCDAEQVPA